MMCQEATALSRMMTGTLHLKYILMYVLLEFRSTHSFTANKIARKLNHNLSKSSFGLTMNLPTIKSFHATHYTKIAA